MIIKSLRKNILLLSEKQTVGSVLGCNTQPGLLSLKTQMTVIHFLLSYLLQYHYLSGK